VLETELFTQNSLISINYHTHN